MLQAKTKGGHKGSDGSCYCMGASRKVVFVIAANGDRGDVTTSEPCNRK